MTRYVKFLLAQTKQDPVEIYINPELVTAVVRMHPTHNTRVCCGEITYYIVDTPEDIILKLEGKS